MKIFIPKHLRNLKLIDDMARMIEEYSKIQSGNSSESYSFRDYYSTLAEDPVSKFIKLNFTEKKFEESIKGGVQTFSSPIAKLGIRKATVSPLASSINFTPDQKYDEVIRYLTKVFYSVKGTPKVFDYLEKYLIETDKINYDGGTINIEIDTITLEDEGMWSSAFEKFLDSLCYFHTLDLKMDQVTIKIESEINNSVGTIIVCFKEFSPEVL